MERIKLLKILGYVQWSVILSDWIISRSLARVLL